MAASASSRRFLVARGYRRLLVPLDTSPESIQAFEIACRLAADDHASVTAIAVIEVPALLPLDAHMQDDEDAARRLLELAGATGELADAWASVRECPQGPRVRPVAQVLRADRSRAIPARSP